MKTCKLMPAMLALALGLSLPGCGKPEKVELKLKWPTGSRALQTLDFQQTVDTFVPGRPAPIQQQMTLRQRYEVTFAKDLPDGGHQVELEFLGTQMTGRAGDTDLNFDTSQPGTGGPLGAAFQKLVGAKVALILDAGNEVQRIEGMDDIQRRKSGAADPAGILKSLFTEESFKQMMNDNRNLPDRPVRPGDSWPVRTEIVMGELGPVLLDYTYTLKSWEKRDQHRLARIQFTGTLATKAGKNLKIAGMDAALEGGKSAGETRFDLERGRFADMSATQDMKMYLTLPSQARGAAAGGTQIITNILNQVILAKEEAK